MRATSRVARWIKKRARVTPLLLIVVEMASTKKSPSCDSPTDSTAL